MKTALARHWKVALAALAVVSLTAGIAYAVTTQVLKDVPAVARFVAGVELDGRNLAVTYDAQGIVPVNPQRPLDFGAIPDFKDLRLWTPFYSQCIYVHNLSNRTGLGPPTTLNIRVVADRIGPLGGGVDLAPAVNCAGRAPQDTSSLSQPESTLKPGATLRARVRLHLTRSPGQRPFAFQVTFGGIGVEPVSGTASVRVSQTDNSGLKALVSFPKARTWQVQVAGETYTQVSIPGTEVAGSGVGLPGTPGIPILRRLVAVPQGAQVSLGTPDLKVRETVRNVLLYPVQPEPPDTHTGDRPEGEVGDFGDRPFIRDEKAYQQNIFLPAEPVSVKRLGRIRDLEVVLVTVATAQYNPAARELRYLDTVSLDLTFQGGSGYFVTKQSLSPFELSRRNMYDSVINVGAVIQFVDPTDLTSALICVGSELVIVTDPDFRSAADDLKAWKRSKGIPTSVVQTDSIVSAGDSISVQREKIQDYLRKQYEECIVRLSYVLLLGDAEHIPPWYTTVAVGENGEVDAGTDWYYGLMNPSGLFDILPDVAVGRISVDTLTEAQTVVNKTIKYEKTPPANLNFYEDISFASYFQCCRASISEQAPPLEAISRLRSWCGTT